MAPSNLLRVKSTFQILQKQYAGRTKVQLHLYKSDPECKTLLILDTIIDEVSFLAVRSNSLTALADSHPNSPIYPTLSAIGCPSPKETISIRKVKLQTHQYST